MLLSTGSSLQTIIACRSALAAALPHLARACSTYRLLDCNAVQQSSALDLLFDPAQDAALDVAQKGSELQQQNRELYRYRTQFPESMWGHLAGLLQARPFPTAVDMSCAAPGAAGAELAHRGFRVAEAVPPGRGTCYPRLPPGCSDLVTCLPGPTSSSHAPEVLAEARRLMAKGGYLAVAWNDRDLSSPFVSELESLLEAINPDYCRSSRQHNPQAWTSALTDGGGMRLVSFTAHPHGLALARCGALQDLLGGLASVRAHLAASSATRKDFHKELRHLVQRHFGDARPFELPLVAKLYVLKNKQPAAHHSAGVGVGGVVRQYSARSVADGDDDEPSHALQHHTRTHA